MQSKIILRMFSFCSLHHGIAYICELVMTLLQCLLAFSFSFFLIVRKATRSISLRNSTLLPLTWKLEGMNGLGEEFSVSAQKGTIGPREEYQLNLHVRSFKQMAVKKNLRLEVRQTLCNKQQEYNVKHNPMLA